MLPVQEALPGLNDIVVPEPVAWTPQTVGWVAVLVVAVGLSVWGLFRRHRRVVANRYRVTALEELEAIERDLSSGARDEALARVPILVKRAALSFTDRDRVASLSGEQWLSFLDETYGGTGFTQGPGRGLTELAYARPGTEETSEDRRELISLVRTWIEVHDARRLHREAPRA